MHKGNADGCGDSGGRGGSDGDDTVIMVMREMIVGSDDASVSGEEQTLLYRTTLPSYRPKFESNLD